MRIQLPLLISCLVLSCRVAAETDPACILEVEDVPFLRDQTVMREMRDTSLANRESWNLLSEAEGKPQLEACTEKTVDCDLPRRRRRRQDAADLYRTGREATLIMGRLYTCGKCDKPHFRFTNTAFVLTEDGMCVTNYHCLEAFRGNADGIKTLHGFVVRTWDGRHYPVSAILAGSKAQDLAIMQVNLPEGETLTPLPLGKTAEVGDTVYTISHPRGILYRFSRGMVTRNAMAKGRPRPGEPWDRPRMSISADYAIGSSGGPVLNERGNLVGIISTTSTLYAGTGNSRNPQMVERETIPVASLRELISTSRD